MDVKTTIPSCNWFSRKTLKCQNRARYLHFSPSFCDVYFLQHESLLRKKVVVRATNNLNLRSNIVARQVA